MPAPRIRPRSGIKIDSIKAEKKVKNLKQRQNEALRAEIEFCQHCKKDVKLCKGNCNIKKEMMKNGNCN